MSTECDMIVVAPVIRPQMEARVVQALHDLPGAANCDTVAAAARAGHKRDGVILTTAAESFMRIRETGAFGKEVFP
jgi:hypothetical protein